jgi:hypothetical protein
MPSLLPEVDWILLDYAYDALEHILGSEQAALSWLNATARDGRVRWARLRESARYFDQPEQFPKEFFRDAETHRDDGTLLVAVDDGTRGEGENGPGQWLRYPDGRALRVLSGYLFVVWRADLIAACPSLEVGAPVPAEMLAEPAGTRQLPKIREPGKKVLRKLAELEAEGEQIFGLDEASGKKLRRKLQKVASRQTVDRMLALYRAGHRAEHFD